MNTEKSEEKNRIEAHTLYLVATPIGNLSDISERAKKVLTEVSFVAAEDTRNSLRLLNCYGIKQTLISYHEHNKHTRGPEIIARLAAGESCALITDAGMPAISDPGEDLVALAAEAGIPVSVIPGCCAAVSALALSALPTARFAFEGFLPVDNRQRKKRFAEIANEKRTLIFYEAPHKLRTTLRDLQKLFGNRKISICRELTKINEEIRRTTLDEAVLYYEEREPRGEYVLVLEGDQESPAVTGVQDASDPTAALSPAARVTQYCESRGISRMESIKLVARELGISKSELYNRLLREEEN